mgnify:CR=1 FL=1
MLYCSNEEIMTNTSFPYQVSGEERQEAILECSQTIQSWGLTMPNTEPLVLDFGLGRFNEIGEIEFWIVNDEKAGYCGKFLFVKDKQTCPYHHHLKKHETFYIVKGSVRMVIDDEEKILNQGDVLIMTPQQKHQFTGIGPALLLEVSMPSMRQDNFFSNRSIGEDGVI